MLNLNKFKELRDLVIKGHFPKFRDKDYQLKSLNSNWMFPKSKHSDSFGYTKWVKNNYGHNRKTN